MDLNACFATIEQQANPHLRNKPVAVAAYKTQNGCILAASYEAKRMGVQTGSRVKDGRKLCPDLIILSPDPWKYRNVHLAFRKLLSRYTSDFDPKSIDEFVLSLDNYPILSRMNMKEVGMEIKKKIKEEIGDYLTVSIGIGPNRFLAKVASNLKKPDGLEEINNNNFLEVYSKLKLINLPYIKFKNAFRLGSVGIRTVLDFYNSPLWKLKAAFESINSYYWYTRLRGYEIDNTPFGRRSYGNSYSLPKPLSYPKELSPILTKLVTKMSERFRRAGYKVRGVHLAISYRDGGFWHHGEALGRSLFDTRDIYKMAFRILTKSPYRKPVRNLAVSSFNLVKEKKLQLDLFEDMEKKEKLTCSMDKVNKRWGDYVVTPATMIGTGGLVPDRIAFGGVKELEEFTFGK